MEQIVVNQYLVLLNGKPLSLITDSGVKEWEAEAVSFNSWFDKVTKDGEHKGKYRCLYQKDGSPEVFLLVEPPSSPDGFRVVLFDHPTQTVH